MLQQQSVRLSNGMTYRYQLPWNGRTRLRGTHKKPIAFDTETELIRPKNPADAGKEKYELDPTHIPQLALATVSDGRTSFFLHPDQLVDFIRLHFREHFVGQNIAFDFWVIDQHLKACSDDRREPALSCWWQIADEGRLHDTLLLDMLFRLAQAVGFEAREDQDTSLSPRNLGELAEDYLGLFIDKSDPFRKRYGELIGVDWASVQEQGFWQYAIKDAIVTALVWHKEVELAEQILRQTKQQFPKEFLPHAQKEWGFLTESLQTRASLALAFITRKGMRVDAEQAARVEAQLREQIRGEIGRMWELEPSVFKYKKEKRGRRLYPLLPTIDNMALTHKGGTPQMDKKALVVVLDRLAEEGGFPAPQSRGKKGNIFTSASVKAWVRYREQSPFLHAWNEAALLSKRLGFFQNIRQHDIIHPRYRPLMRTGRVSCYKPNIQQFPREQDIRAIFIARPGFKLLTIDFSALELRTLAVVCEHRFGFSKLADTIRAGVDPHAYTAALILNLPLAAFTALKETNEALFKDARQKAKVLNFGAPGGLGAVKLAAYAFASYGVDMLVEEAATLRHKLITQVYPELALYLGDTSLEAMAWNFGIPVRRIKKAFDIDEQEDGPEWTFRIMRAVGKVIRGKPYKADGTPYKQQFIDRIWASVRRLASDSGRLPVKIKEQIREKQASENLERALLCGPALSITGRVRGSATYTQARNTPFQSLAADGGKLALWELIKAGFCPIAFIHDEVVVEVPEATAEADAERVDRILVSAMEKILNYQIPVACSRQVADCWQK